MSIEKRLVFDATTGTTVEEEFEFTPVPIDQLPAIRAERDARLALSDKPFLRHLDEREDGVTTLTEEQFDELRAYRKELRDFPETCDPQNPLWPSKPSFM